MFINYAHRGASEYAPENTLAAFCLGIQMNANGIETDVRKTADGKLVLFHDDTMTRLAGVNLAVEQCTYSQLIKMDLGSRTNPLYTGERIVLLEDFLRYFGNRELQLAIELKGAGVEFDTMDAIYRYNCQNHTIVTSFSLDYLQTVRSFDKQIPLGFLTDQTTNAVLETLLERQIQQYCPQACSITAELVSRAKGKGLSVRAWGVQNTALMNQALACGVDGMTVNFPDKLAAVLTAGANSPT